MKKDYSYGIVPLREENGEIQILMIFHKGGRHWAFPKGHKDEGESDFETAQRELLEETGLSVSSCLSQIPYVESYQFYKFHEKIYKTVAYFPAFVSGELKLQPEEIVDAKWLPLETAHLHLTFKESKEICFKVLELLKNI